MTSLPHQGTDRSGGRPRAALVADEPFRFLRQFESRDVSFGHRAQLLRSRSRVRPADSQWFAGDSLQDRFARELCARGVLPFKELLEAFEFFARVRRRVKAAQVVDLCCGHGLAGVLYALFERSVDQVLLLDRKIPPSASRVLEAATAAGPWVRDKVHFAESPLKVASREVDAGAAMIGVHACGLRTDEILQLAIATGGPVAVLPCCRPHRRHPAPLSLRNALGADVAIDVERTYRLEAAGYRVRWDAIPGEITPMNRVLQGVPR